MKQVIWIIQVAVLYCFTWFVAFLPESVTRKTGVWLGLAMRKVLASRRRIAEENIRNCIDYMRSQPEWKCTMSQPEEIARQVFCNIASSLVEACRLYHGHGKSLIKQIEIRGVQNYEAARAKGKGIIFLTGHCGNWELMALSCPGLLGTPLAVVARRQNNPYLNRMVEKMRMRYDNIVIYKDNALKNMLSVIKKNGTLGILVDQSVFQAEGCLINFLGRPAWASKAPVVMVRKTGVEVLPVFIHRDGNRHVLEIHPAIRFSGEQGEQGMAADVQIYSSYIEKFIIAHPEDWYWVHRRWKRTEGL